MVNGRVAPSSLPLKRKVYLYLSVEQLPKAIKQDYPKWVNRVHIVEKGFGDAKPMKLNTTQKGILDELNNWSVVLKPRQVGGTTLMLTLLLYFCDRIKNAQCSLISYNMDNSEYHLKTIRGIVESLPSEYAMPLSKDSCKEMLVFKHTGATIFAKSGGTQTAGRGSKYLAVLSTEASYWTKDYDAFKAYSKAIVPGGYNLMESTPNGMGNLYQETYFSARESTIQSWNVFKNIFRPWPIHPDFAIKPPHKLEYTPDEKELIRTHGLTDAQLFWRRTQLDGFPNYSQRKYAEFMSEYPIDDESCWLETNDSPFEMTYFKKLLIKDPGYGKHQERIYLPMQRERKYFMGVDTSLGKDNSDQMSFVVLDDLGNVVCVFADNVNYTRFVHIAIEAMQYYQANVFVELTGGYGFGALERMNASKPRGVKVSEWSTNGTSKELMFNKINDWMANNKNVNDKQLREQIMKYNMSAKNNKDDVLMAFGMALECLLSNKRARFEITLPKREDNIAYEKQRANFIR